MKNPKLTLEITNNGLMRNISNCSIDDLIKMLVSTCNEENEIGLSVRASILIASANILENAEKDVKDVLFNQANNFISKIH